MEQTTEAWADKEADVASTTTEYVAHYVPADGSCFFHAVIDQLIRLHIPYSGNAADLRKKAYETIFKDWNFVKDFIPVEQQNSYLDDVSKPNFFADHFLINATARLLNICIIVFDNTLLNNFTYRYTFGVDLNPKIVLGLKNLHFWSLTLEPHSDPLTHSTEQDLVIPVECEATVLPPTYIMGPGEPLECETAPAPVVQMTTNPRSEFRAFEHCNNPTVDEKKNEIQIVHPVELFRATVGDEKGDVDHPASLRKHCNIKKKTNTKTLIEAGREPKSHHCMFRPRQVKYLEKLNQRFIKIRKILDGYIVKLYSLSKENSPLKELQTYNEENITKYFKFLSDLKSLDCIAGSMEDLEECLAPLTGAPKQIFSTVPVQCSEESSIGHWLLAKFEALPVVPVPPTDGVECMECETIPTNDDNLSRNVVFIDTLAAQSLQETLRFENFDVSLRRKGFCTIKSFYADNQPKGTYQCGYISIGSLIHCVYRRDLSSFPFRNRLLGNPTAFVKFCNNLIGEPNAAAIWLTDENLIKIVYMVKFIQDNFKINFEINLTDFDWIQAHDISKTICKSEQLFTKLQKIRGNFRLRLDALVRYVDDSQSSSIENSSLLKDLTKFTDILLEYSNVLPIVKFPYQFDGIGTSVHFAKFMKQFEDGSSKLLQFYVILNTEPRM